MRIALVGKGGSGKSSLSWLMAQYLSADTTNNVLAIDADHNMDLTSNLGFEITDSSKLFYNSNQDFRGLIGVKSDQKWFTQFGLAATGENFVQFNYKPADGFLAQYINPLTPNLDLLIVGLGQEDIMYTGVCSHELSAPLKFLLPRLVLSDNSHIVMDSVAGSDMINYGMYFGFDVVVVAVEGNSNSIKVAKQLDVLLSKQGIQLYFILNKYNPNNQLIKDFIADNGVARRVIGDIPADLEIMNYDYANVSEQTKASLTTIIHTIEQLPQVSSQGFERLQYFETKKMELRSLPKV